MYIGYCKDVSYSYTRVGGKIPFEPEYGEGGEVIFTWSRLYNAGLEIHAQLPKECYVGAVTIPLLPKAKICGAKLIVNGKTVGVYSAGTGKTSSGDITVDAGIFTDSFTVRIETSVYEVSFTEPKISIICDDDKPLLWPTPKSAEYSEGYVKIAELTSDGTEDAEYAKKFLGEVLAERFGDVLDPAGVKVKLVISNSEDYKDERYTVSVTRDGITLTAATRITLLYAVYALVALYGKDGARLANIDTKPSKEWRGYHMGLPKPANLVFAKRLFRDILLPLGYNTIFVQIIGSMEFEKHPEITESWKRELALNPKYPHYYMGCDGETITKAEVSDLMDYAHELGFEVIPEVQSLGHVQWITSAHPEIAEIAEEDKKVDDTRNEDERPAAKYHHCYCPSNEKSYEILFDVMEEIIEVTRPQRFVHIGHDEVYYLGLCEKCKNTPHDVLFARDVNRIYNHLKELGYRTMMWSDMIQPVTKYQTPGAIKMIPKDIVMLDFIWYFHLDKDIEENLFPDGYTVMAGNLYSSHYPRYHKRMNVPEMHGGQVSSWCQVDEYRMGKKGKFWDLTYTAEMLWNPENYFDDQRCAFSHVISKYIQPTQRDLIRGKYNVQGYAEERIALPRGDATDIPCELLKAYPDAIIADGATVKVGAKYDRLVIEHTTLTKEMRIPWQELILSGEYTVSFTDGTSFVSRAEYAGGVLSYDSKYGYPLPEAVHRHTGYIATWFSDPVFEGKTKRGEDVLVLGYVVENPYPEKTIDSISYKRAEEDISEVVLCGIRGLNKK